MTPARRLAALALFSGSVSATGDAIAQGLDAWARDGAAQRGDYDRTRTLRYFVYGAAFAPISVRWHAFLNARFPLQAPATAARPLRSTAAAVLKRIVADQAAFAPFACGAFVVGMGALEGLGLGELLERMRERYPRILLAGYCVWPAAQLVNFSVVPLAYRVPFGSTVGLFWNTYLSWTSARLERARRPAPQTQAHAPAQAARVDTPVNGGPAA
ncbi:hypothetical protein LPJ61_000988 [Coemansia biformis]|uniref:Uncharacterized protein n=1 Tax=Coemansia biformis TaxID=1286918 RepID=A0A9W7YAT9_9FUNG|nr:hypothetical protein LPJ61_000988 [Coemansia biformis]